MVAKCFPETAPDDPNHSLFHSGELTLKAHQVGFIVSGIFTVLAFIITTWHVRKHCLFYTSPRHQRYIIRILLMCPFYAILSFLSYFWWKESLYFELVRDSYEALVIASFFYLILECAGANTVELAISLKNCDFHKWLWPLGKIRRVPRPWTMLMICKIGVLQYIILRPLTTLIALILEFVGYYCYDSWSPLYFHLWDVIIVSISVSIAMYCLLQIMVALKETLTPTKPMLKFLAVKGLVFIIFWQSVVVSVLAYFGWGVKASQYWTLDQVEAGLEALLITFEMVLFALFQIKAFTYLAYRPVGADSLERRDLRTRPWRAFFRAMDFRDIGREVKLSTVYLGHRVQGKDPRVGREEDHEKIFGKHRARVAAEVLEEERKARKAKKKAGVEGDELTEIEKELQLLREKDVDQDEKRDSIEDLRPLLKDSHSPLLWTADMEERDLSFGTEVRFPPHVQVSVPQEHARSEYSFDTAKKSQAPSPSDLRERTRSGGGLGITGVSSPTASTPIYEAPDHFTAWPSRSPRVDPRRRQSAAMSTPREERSAFLGDVILPPSDFDGREFGRLMLGIDGQSASKRHSLDGPLRLPRHQVDSLTLNSPPKSRRLSLDQPASPRGPRHPDLSPPLPSPGITIISRSPRRMSQQVTSPPPHQRFVFDEV